MRHLVNFALLFSFLTLLVSGILSFSQPFSLATTRVHVFFGTITTILIGLHLAVRIKYFKTQFRNSIKRDTNKASGISLAAIATLTGVWCLSLVAALMGWPPASWLLQQSYESRNHAQIVRASSFAGFVDSQAHQRMVARQPNPESGCGLTLTIEFNRSLDTLPSIAVWTESTTGTMIETLFLDSQVAYSDTPNWNGQVTPRNLIFPVWRNRYTAVSGIDPTGEVDAVTAATSAHSFSLDDYLVLGGDSQFILCVEVNLPADPNDRFTDSHLGQPSLIYTALIDTSAEQRYSILELTGHGGGAEVSGAIQYDLDGVTSAKYLVDLLLAKVHQESD